MNEILKTIVGSRAHGTALPESDYDYRGVFVVPVEDFISPFRNVKNNHWLEGETDNTSYELSHFVKLCAHGNPSALELLVAPVESVTDEGRRLRAMLPSFLSRRVIPSFSGYSRSQEKKFRDNHMERRWKYAEAHIRTMYQLIHLLKTGELKVGWEGEQLQRLNQVKRGGWTEAEVMTHVLFLEQEAKDLAVHSELPEEPDIERIENFIFSIYLPRNAEQLCESQRIGKMG